jgi:NAD(P) transhydrogenase subunit alpha
LQNSIFLQIIHSDGSPNLPLIMLLFVPKEKAPEKRCALIPEDVTKLTKLGLDITLESGAGIESGFSDADYEKAGAKISSDKAKSLANADILFKVLKPELKDIQLLKKDCLQLSFLDPFNEPALLDALAKQGVRTVSLEMIPRTTLAQKMDVISSQANLAGYNAVVLAASRLSKIIPMMMTPAGTLSPAKFFIVGVGVAGLQAIATAKRLGARVEAFDTRPVVEEQVKSLGAKFVKIDLGETGQTEQGYAKALTDEQIQKQREGMKKVCATSDVVITTAKLFARKAPVIITKEMVAAMKPGSLIVDLAAETGGNVEGTQPGQEVMTENGVLIIGPDTLEANVPQHASQMFSANLTHFISHFWCKDSKSFKFDLEDPIQKHCMLTSDGKIVHPQFIKTTAQS